MLGEWGSTMNPLISLSGMAPMNNGHVAVNRPFLSGWYPSLAEGWNQAVLAPQPTLQP